MEGTHILAAIRDVERTVVSAEVWNGDYARPRKIPDSPALRAMISAYFPKRRQWQQF